jgi:MFS family permease
MPAGILALLILVFPESPRWLIDHGKEDQGLQTLARLHANGDSGDAWVLAEYRQIQLAVAHEHEQAAGAYRDLFTEKSSLRRLLLVTALQASVQMTGVSAIQYFTPEIYATINIGTTESLKYQGISNVLSVLAQLCTILFIDHIGRRWPLIIGNAINGVCFIIVTVAIASFPNASPSGQNALGWTFIVINWCYQVSFSFTCGSLSWIIPAEVFDMKTRSKGVSIGVMTSFAFNTMIGQITSPAINNIGWRYFLLFVVCNFTNAIFFWAFMPETKKRPLEEMNVLFSETPWFVPTANTKNIKSDLETQVQAAKMEKENVTQVEEVTH